MTLYLGDNVKTKQPIRFSPKLLTQHCAIVGMTGSGKTGMILGMVEDLLESNTPAVLIDIKGDMANILLQDKSFQDRLNVKIYTPGADHGTKVNIFSNMEDPSRVNNAVSALLKMIKEKDTDPVNIKHVFLSTILHHNHRNNLECSLKTLIDDILEPPFVSLGKMELDAVFPDRSRQALAAKLNSLLAAPSFQDWYDGERLDLDELLKKRDDGKVNVTVYSVAHIVNEDQRMFALSLILDEMLCWMRRQEGSDDLRAVCVVDECAGILPPYPANPPTKLPVMTMLKQARAFGLGLILSSQNPMDFDYKAMSNCGTWIIGRLQMKNDRERVLDAVTSSNPYGRQTLNDRIARLLPRQFTLVRQNVCEDILSKNVKCQLRGPMHPMEISSLVRKYSENVNEYEIDFGDV